MKLKEWNIFQIGIAERVAKVLGITTEDLFLEKDFGHYFAEYVDRDADRPDPFYLTGQLITFYKTQDKEKK